MSFFLVDQRTCHTKISHKLNIKNLKLLYFFRLTNNAGDFIMRYTTVCFFTANLLFCSQVYAINLGKIQVNSALNEPFQAQVPVFNVGEKDINTINAKIAENYAFLNARMERKPIIDGIRLGLQQDESGQYSISLSSDASVNDLFLQIILDVDSNQQRLSKEYTVLLDPKGYNPHQTKRIPERTVKTFKAKQQKVAAKKEASHSMDSSIGHESHDMKGSVESHSMESSIGSDSHDMKGSVAESHSMESSIGSDSHDMKGSVAESHSMESSIGSDSHDMKGSVAESHSMESSIGSDSHDMKGSVSESHSMESSIGSDSHDMKGSVSESHSMESSIGSDSHDMKGSVAESHSMESSIGSDSHDMKGSVSESHSMESSIGSDSHDMKGSVSLNK